MKSLSPRHVEAMLVDSLRLTDPAEVRRILQGYPGLPELRDEAGAEIQSWDLAGRGDDDCHNDSNDDDDNNHQHQHQHRQHRNDHHDSDDHHDNDDHQDNDDRQKAARDDRARADGRAGRADCERGVGGARGGDVSNMPELLAALSRAIEEEIRGSKGLFGLVTGTLERLKSGTKVTPFLRHGSVRRQESEGATPNGLASGGMKKWWRCPRCHISQVDIIPG